MTVLSGGFSGGRVFRDFLRVLPLLHQPARQHRGGIFLHPQAEERADLLAEMAAWLRRESS